MDFEHIRDITELEKSPAPSWLWDPLLNRISWANIAGLKFWGADNIFDILERRFDPQDHSIQFINSCYRDLSASAQKFSQDVSGYSSEESLSFSASQYQDRYSYKLTLMRLPDQRVGLLIHALSHPFQNQNKDGNLSVANLPMPALMISATGEIAEINAEAEGFFETHYKFEEMIMRCEKSGMISETLSLKTDFGTRDIQYTLKKLDPESRSSAFLMLFDDVTDRKRTEKHLLEKLEYKTRREENSSGETRNLKSTGHLKPEEADKFLALGKTLISESSVSPTSPPEAPIETESANDSTELFQRIGELEAILNAAMDGIFTLDEKGHILSINAGAEAIFGLAKEDIQKKHFTTLFEPDSAKVVEEYLASLNAQGIASIFNDGREVIGVEKGGGNIPIFLTINPLLDQTVGETSGHLKFCALVRDITQWKETEAELTRAKEEAEQTSLEKSNFLNSLSHEIRTPLNAILGFVDLMKTEKFGPLGDQRYKGYLTDIQTSGKHLMELTSGLLDLARMQAGKMEMNFTSVEPSEIIEQCVSILQEEAKRENILVRTDLHDDIPQIVADQGALRQIILNLLSNSIKFSKAGSQVIISTQLESSGEVTINVSDTGIGMNEDELKMALEPFSQTPRGKKVTKVSGTGLGLPLSRALAEANRARFDITSSPQKGTSIDIIFPNSRVLTE